MYVDQVLVRWLKVLTAVAVQWLKQWFTMFLKKNVIWYQKKIANSSQNKFHSKYIPFFYANQIKNLNHTVTKFLVVLGVR